MLSLLKILPTYDGNAAWQTLKDSSCQAWRSKTRDSREIDVIVTILCSSLRKQKASEIIAYSMHVSREIHDVRSYDGHDYFYMLPLS